MPRFQEVYKYVSHLSFSLKHPFFFSFRNRVKPKAMNEEKSRLHKTNQITQKAPELSSGATKGLWFVPKSQI